MKEYVRTSKRKTHANKAGRLTQDLTSLPYKPT